MTLSKSKAVDFTILRFLVCFGLAIVWALAAQTGFAGEQWSRFRGPNGTGLADTDQLPIKVGDSNKVWKVDLQGTGSSSPVVWDRKVFLTSVGKATAAGADLKIHCIDIESGKIAWTKTHPVSPNRIHNRNSIASSTPAVDDQHVYLAVGDRDGARLLAYSHNGELAWQHKLGRFPSQHGFGASPIVVDDKLILFDSQQAQRMRRGEEPGTSHMLALDKSNGTPVWQTELKATRACYAVPAVMKTSTGETQVVSCNTGNGFFGIDLKSGTLRWAHSPFRMRTVASMVWTGERLLGSCGSGGGGNYLVALKPKADDSAQPFEVAYRIDKANYVPSPIAVGKRLFLFTDKGIGRCFDVKSGDMIWQKRLGDGFSGSPVCANDHLYVVDESGKLLVISTEKDASVVCKYDLGESSRATPAISDDRLLVRTESTLFCFFSEPESDSGSTSKK